MASGIVIVKQYERLVVLKWGRLAQIAPPGFRFLIPIIYTGRSVDLREQVVRVPTQKYITKDNVVVDMDFVLYYRVMADQAEKSVLEVADHHAAVRNLAVGELRSIVGNFTLGDALSERERMQSQLQVALDENTGRWGVKVLQAAILQAEGRRQAAILEAEGDQQAQVLRAQGFSSALERIYQVANTVDVKTMSLQYFDTLKSLGSSPSTKFIFPMEFTSMLSPLLGMGAGNHRQGNGGSAASQT